MEEPQSPLTWGEVLSWAEMNGIGEEFVVMDEDGSLFRHLAVTEDPFRGRPAVQFQRRQQ